MITPTVAGIGRVCWSCGQGVITGLRGVLGEPAQGPVDPGGAVVVDVPGLPGVPGVGGFFVEAAGDADGAGNGVLTRCDGEADFQGGEFAGGVAGIAAVAVQGGDAVLVQA